MKQKGDELLVINKRVFILILTAIAFVGIVIGYTIGYITTPVKEIEIKRVNEAEKTVLPQTVDTAFAKKQESPSEEQKTQIPKQEEKNIEKQTTEKEKVTKTDQSEKEEKAETKNLEGRKSAEKGLKKLQTSALRKSPQKSLPGKRSFYTVQVGAFSDISNTKTVQEKLENAGYKSFLSKEDLYKVRVGRFDRFLQAKKLSEELNAKGIENFIVKVNIASTGGKK
ncbi:SPOR domain-containing protein [Thermodesulfovibrio sp.]|uniref:SPOR domain-containing protein n=1 Tax=Thermodesulfovibrio sp. TaxID=2067987 RepID=UPI0030EC3ED6